MSLITHPCTTCGHPDFWRSGFGSRSPGKCSCGCNCTPGAPEVRPTFDRASNQVEQIIPPGEKDRGRFMVPLCGCQACKALYEQLTT